MIEEKSGIELLAHLCENFGPTGCETQVGEAVISQIGDRCDKLCCDTLGNIYGVIYGAGENRKRIMLSSHMDEVGFMVTGICDNGYIKFSTLGGIDERVFYGKRVVIGNENRHIGGVIAAKAIHHKKKEERYKVTKISDMYIDIGASDREEAEKYVEVGDFAVFDSDFVRFGKNDSFIKGKAIDDRAGCSTMIEIIRRIRDENVLLPFDVYFCFTVREEVGLSGAKVAAERVRPDKAIILETTAVADIADVPEAKRVADLGNGGVISIMDRSTIYDTSFISFALDCAKRHGIKAQVKRYVSGGNDAGHIHKSGIGVRCIALSLPTRYLHSPACVASAEDYNSINELVFAMLKEMKSEDNNV